MAVRGSQIMFGVLIAGDRVDGLGLGTADEFPDSRAARRALDKNGGMFSATGGGMSESCPVCPKTHLEVADLQGPNAPDDWLAVSEGERMEAELTPDVCILPDKGLTRHFIRGHIQLPVQDVTSEVFVWSVWVELDSDAMETIARSWTNPNRAALPPIHGRLANELPYERATRGLRITVHTRDPGLVPLLMVRADHTLAVEQREGIDLHRMVEFEDLVSR